MRYQFLMSVRWVFVPAIGAPIAHAPVLRWDLASGLKRPISRGLFGQNKSWRGALVMTAGTVGAASALYRVPAYRRRLPDSLSDANPTTVGLLLGIATWLGELPNSFLKRRLRIPPGERLHSPAGVIISIFDQADWVPLACLLLRPIVRVNARDGAIVFAIVAVAHLPINLIGYAVGARKHPL